MRGREQEAGSKNKDSPCVANDGLSCLMQAPRLVYANSSPSSQYCIVSVAEG